MAYVIAEPCIGVKDASCTEVCPVDCIQPLSGSPEFVRTDQLFINPDECVCCHLCVEECPVGAIFAEGDLPTEWQSYVEKNAAHFRK